MKRIAVLMTAVLMVFGTQLYGQPNDMKQTHKFMENSTLPMNKRKMLERFTLMLKNKELLKKQKWKPHV